MSKPIKVAHFSSDFDVDDNTNDPEKFSPSVFFPAIFNKSTFVILCFLIISVCLPALLFLDIFDEGKLPPKIQGVCLVDNSYRIPCGMTNISKADCNIILCCFETKTNSCYHHEPSNYYYYQKDEKDSYYIPSQDNTPLGLPSVKQVKMNYVEDEGSLKISLTDTRKFLKSTKDGLKNFDILNSGNKKLSISVYRKNTTEIILTTLKGPLIVNEDYLEWTVQLTNSSGILFGLGGLKIDSKVNSTVTRVIYKNQDDHNTLPMFMAYSNGKYHAAIISHEGALQVTVLPSYLIHLKTLYTGSVQIQLIDGPTPKNIYEKIRKQLDKRSYFSEWAHGVHICREEPAMNIKALVDQYTSFISNKNKFPDFTYESDCVHDDLLLHILAENYTSKQTTDLIKNMNMKEKFILSYPPQIPLNSKLFQKFENSSIFYNSTQDGELFVGKYKNFDVVYPIYSHKDIGDLVQEVLALFQDLEINGLTFTNSWPQDDSYQMKNSTDLFVDKKIQDSFSHTIPWDLKEGQDIHARYHNKYGSTFAQVVEEKAVAELTFSPISDYNANRPLIIQNLNTSWTNLNTTLQNSLFSSLFGLNFLTVPVCGSSNSYDQKTQEDLCLRWYLVAATMPIVRVSSKSLQRSPTNLYTNYTIEKVISILDTRRSLLPYYRAILNNGGPFVRPMFYNFPDDKNVLSLVDQYMVGDGLLVAQPLSPDIEIMEIYLPPNKAWYEIWGGAMYRTKKGKERIKFPIVKSDWISFILEGHIVPLVKETTSSPEITLKIGLNCNHDPCQAKGSLIYGKFGDTVITFNAAEKNITIDPPTVNQKDVKDMIKTVCYYNYTSNECHSFTGK